VIIFEDEAGFTLHPKLGRTWAKKGSKPFVFTKSQHRQRVNVFGWVEITTGQHGMMDSEKGDTNGFIGILRQILNRFKNKTVDLWVDRAKWHKNKRVEKFCDEEPMLNIHYLPPYHPELNYQEAMWRTMRYEETTNTYYEEIIEMRCAIFKRSQSWKPKKIKSLCPLI